MTKRSELFFGFIQIPVDIAMIMVAFVLAYYIRSDFDSAPFYSTIGLSTYLSYAMYIAPIWIGIFALNGLYSLRSYNKVGSDLYKIAIASSAAVLILIVMIFLSKSLFFSRLILSYTWIISIFTIAFGRLTLQLLQRYLLRYGIGQRVVAVIGNNKVSEEVVKTIQNNNLSYKIAGIIASDPKDENSNHKLLGGLDNIGLLIKKYKIDEIVLTDSKIAHKTLMDIMRTCDDQKISFKYVPDLLDIVTSNFRLSLIGSTPVMELKTIPLEGWGRIIKRVFDLLFAAIFLIVLLPIYIIIALLVKLTSKGPVMYLHQRVGRDGKVFNFYKFRSMYYEKCDYKGGVYWTTQADEKTRITPLGKFLRKTNLDELPQFWNILKGDMSFVGPRPELPKLVQKFEKEIPDYFRRHRVKTGLTGWAQVNGLKGDTSIEDRVKYDIYYIENWSLWFDFKIIIKTIFLIAYEAFAGKYEYRTRS